MGLWGHRWGVDQSGGLLGEDAGSLSQKAWAGRRRNRVRYGDRMDRTCDWVEGRGTREK